ncbi:hypothetical protein M0802_012022 [Mischocyttarus mexicanus]|nr:hypothetical protein M0802_012022 [Mischocyttarus mexicanus]
MHTSEFATVVRHGEKKIIQKLLCVIDYNSCMGSVDKTHMVLSTINATRKSLKWYRKYFFHLLNICVWNAYCLYKHNTQNPISMAKFHLNLIREILQKYHINISYNHQKGNNNPLRLLERHFPSLYKPQRNNRNRKASSARQMTKDAILDMSVKILMLV